MLASNNLWACSSLRCFPLHIISLFGTVPNILCSYTFSVGTLFYCCKSPEEKFSPATLPVIADSLYLYALFSFLYSLAVILLVLWLYSELINNKVRAAECCLWHPFSIVLKPHKGGGMGILQLHGCVNYACLALQARGTPSLWRHVPRPLIWCIYLVGGFYLSLAGFSLPNLAHQSLVYSLFLCAIMQGSILPVTIPPRAHPRGFAIFFLLGGLFRTPGHAERDNSRPLGNAHRPQIRCFVFKIDFRIIAQPDVLTRT